MMNMTELKKNSQAIAKYLSEYYHGSDHILPPARWIGAGAEALSLNADGRDTTRDIDRVLRGIDPNTGEPLTRARKKFGYDLTFSSEKYVSLMYVMATETLRKQIADAHVRAVEKTLAVGLPLVLARWGKGGQFSEVGEVVAYMVHHIDSRAGDPQLHTHILLSNLVRALSVDKWVGVESKDLASAVKALGALFREYEAQEMRALGFDVRAEREVGQNGDTGEVWHKIEGLAPEIEKHFSKRREEIERVAKAKGISFDDAAQSTRHGKTEANTPEAVIAYAREEVARMGWNIDANALRAGRDQVVATDPAFVPKTRAQVLDALHAHESSFSVWDFVAAEAKEGRTLGSRAEALDAIERVGDVIRLDNERYISRVQYDRELGIVVNALARAHETAHKVDASIVEDAIARHEAAMSEKLGKVVQLSDEQKNAVRHVCAGGGVSLILGKAGTGKTASAGAFMLAFEAAEFNIIGTSTSERATRNLGSETERGAWNTLKLLTELDSGARTLTARDVVVIDEGGMMSARDFAAIQNHADRAGAKIIAIGDHFQLQAVGAGNPFRDLMTRMESAELGDIRRQIHEAERAIARAMNDGTRGADIVAMWQKGGMLNTFSDKSKNAERMAALTALVSDYMADTSKNKIILGHKHDDLSVINNAIRAERAARGELGEERVVNIWAGGGTRKTDQAFAVGDLVVFTKNERGARKGDAPKWSNGETGEVIGWTANAMRVQIRSDQPGREGFVVEVPIGRKAASVLPGYAMTVHKSQGLSVGHVYYAPGDNIDRNIGMVAYTRTKETFRMYAGASQLDAIVKGIDEWRFKLSALDLAPISKLTLDELVANRRAEREHTQAIARAERAQAKSLDAERRAPEPTPTVPPAMPLDALNAGVRGGEPVATWREQAAKWWARYNPPRAVPATTRDAERAAGVPVARVLDTLAQCVAQDAARALAAATAAVKTADDAARAVAVARKERDVLKPVGEIFRARVRESTGVDIIKPEGSAWFGNAAAVSRTVADYIKRGKWSWAGTKPSPEIVRTVEAARRWRVAWDTSDAKVQNAKSVEHTERTKHAAELAARSQAQTAHEQAVAQAERTRNALQAAQSAAKARARVPFQQEDARRQAHAQAFAQIEGRRYEAAVDQAQRQRQQSRGHGHSR